MIYCLVVRLKRAAILACSSHISKYFDIWLALGHFAVSKKVVNAMIVRRKQNPQLVGAMKP
jgi:hypothetical protein